MRDNASPGNHKQSNKKAQSRVWDTSLQVAGRGSLRNPRTTQAIAIAFACPSELGSMTLLLEVTGRTRSNWAGTEQYTSDGQLPQFLKVLGRLLGARGTKSLTQLWTLWPKIRHAHGCNSGPNILGSQQLPDWERSWAWDYKPANNLWS